jgi:hypothetical protein
MFTVLRAASRTIRHLLTAGLVAEPSLKSFFGPGGKMKVSLLTPEQMTVVGTEGISVWMYRVVRDEERLNDPDVRLNSGLLLPPPLPLRAHYLVTPMTSAAAGGGPETDQVLLGKLLQVFNDHPKLRGADLRDELSGTDAVLNVRLEPLSLQDIYQIWDALEGSYRLSVSYEVTVLNIDPAQEPSGVGTVTAILPNYEEIVGTP